MLDDRPQRLVGVAGLGDDVDPRALQKPRDPGAQEHLVVGDQDPQDVHRPGR